MRQNHSEIGYYIGEGLESKIFETSDEKGTYIVKQWKEPSNINSILYQLHMQQKCVEFGISPKIIAINLDTKRVLMEKFHCNLLTFLTKMKNKHSHTLMKDIQDGIIHQWKSLDKLQIFHNDPNICNIMLDSNFNVKLIDFGFSIKCDDKQNITNMKCNPKAYVKWIQEWNKNNPSNRITTDSYSTIIHTK